MPAESGARRHVISIGNFDGVHLGHKAILREARAMADASDAGVLALPFDPHPATWLAPERVPPRLTSRTQRERWLRAAGCDEVVFLTPDEQTLGQEAEAFIEGLVERYRPTGFVEGPDFRFGHQRKGDLDLLRSLGETHGFAVRVVEPVEVVLHDRMVHRAGSSLARWLVGHGRVEDATRVLGRAFALESTIVKGEQRGRGIGFPTINLDAEALRPFILPADGVYAGMAEIEGETQAYPAAISVGVKPTFKGSEVTVEAHLLGLDDEVYGRGVSLSFVKWVRDQQAFDGLEALVRQLSRDVEQVRAWADEDVLVVGDPAMASVVKRLAGA
ncbi:riboflavin biosynthesis protein RibF [Mucisphaera sp.]|uniref:riboflavin biosynthesis protein RibF n=1 Tax=Mucisphaera sp. TaxID=2913024 RepID=UPI003D0C145C